MNTLKKALTLLFILAMLATNSLMAKPPMKGEEAEKTDDGTRTVPQMYAYGIGFTPADSTVYMTDVLILKNAKLTKKRGFLSGRKDLSDQLKNYLTSKGEENRSCAIVYKEELSAISKDYDKLKAKYEKQGYLVKTVSQTDFRFTVPE